MAIHFEIGPGNVGVKWFYESAGEVSGCEVEEFADVTIVLVEGAGLGVRSNNYNVVPMDQLAFIIKGFGDRRIIQFRTISDGQAYIEVVSGTIESNSADPTSVFANFHVKVTKSTAAKPTKVQLNEPHSALNSSASDMIPYRMTYIYTIPYSSNAEEMLAKVDESSRHLAIASHGKPGIIEIGNYFTIRNVEKFEHLRADPRTC